jgi:hypothetical protein
MRHNGCTLNKGKHVRHWTKDGNKLSFYPNLRAEMQGDCIGKITFVCKDDDEKVHIYLFNRGDYNQLVENFIMTGTLYPPTELETKIVNWGPFELELEGVFGIPEEMFG